MKLLKLERLHKGKFLSYYVADYLNKDGNIKQYEFISRDPNLTIENFGKNQPAGVGMVVFSKDKNKVLLESEFRLATNHFVYNFPAGLIDKGETASEAAKRELKEETGLDMIHLVVCEAEGEIKESCFADEEINTRWYTKEEIKTLINQGAYMSVRTQMFLWQWINEK